MAGWEAREHRRGCLGVNEPSRRLTPARTHATSPCRELLLFSKRSSSACAWVVVGATCCLALAPRYASATEPPLPEEYLPSAVAYPRHAFAQAEVAVALVSRDGRLLRAFAPSLVGGYRFNQLGVFAITGVNYWRSPTLTVGDVEPVGVYVLGLGGEYRYAQDFARTSLAMGISVLTSAPSGDEPGAVGYYFDLRPVGMSWRLAPSWKVGFDPLGFRVLIPDLGGIPLAEIQFTTGVHVEWRGL